MKDARGVERGACTRCTCQQYSPPGAGTGSFKCVTCSHAPGLHQNISSASAPSYGHSGDHTTCCVVGCNQEADFDPNTGTEMNYCYGHATGQIPVHTPPKPVGGAHIRQDGTLFDNSDCITMVLPHIPQQDGFVLPVPPNMCTTVGPFQTPFQPADGLVPPGLTGAALNIPMSALNPQTAVFPGLQTVQLGIKKCALAECPNPSHIDENGCVHECCSRVHDAEHQRRKLQQCFIGTSQPVPPPFNVPFPPPPPPPPLPLPMQLPSGAKKCAIPECPNPCYIDPSGTVHECCGITHAMEHQRRKAIKQQHQVSKGVTHCLLPECNKLVWPFKNYCGKTHADIGVQRGLVPPAPPAAQTGPKDSSMCIIPDCMNKKYSEPGGMTHPYCGKGHAELAKKMNIKPTADKPEDQCELPGCQQPKRKEGTRVHDYCCLDHANQDGPNRALRILTSSTDVKKFLAQFPKLKVTKMVENPAAMQGGELFKRFKQKWDSLPQSQRTTCLAFHGTAESSISSICQNGYDSKLRKGQAYGAGEYFATTPDIPLGYCKGGKRMLLNELLLGQPSVHHTRHGNIVVMKDSAHDLPRFVLTFQ